MAWGRPGGDGSAGDGKEAAVRHTSLFLLALAASTGLAGCGSGARDGSEELRRAASVADGMGGWPAQYIALGGSPGFVYSIHPAARTLSVQVMDGRLRAHERDVKVVLPYEPTAITGVGTDVVFVAGRTDADQTIIDRFVRNAQSERLSFQRRRLLEDADVGVLSSLARVLVHESAHLVMLDSSEGALWSLGEGADKVELVASADTIPALRSMRSLAALPRSDGSTGASYTLGEEWPGDDTIDVAGTVVSLRDDHIGDGVVDEVRVFARAAPSGGR